MISRRPHSRQENVQRAHPITTHAAHTQARAAGRADQSNHHDLWVVHRPAAARRKAVQ